MVRELRANDPFENARGNMTSSDIAIKLLIILLIILINVINNISVASVNEPLSPKG